MQIPAFWCTFSESAKYHTFPSQDVLRAPGTGFDLWNFWSHSEVQH